MLDVKQVPHKQHWQVKLDGQVIGHIKKIEGESFQYFPIGCSVGGDKYPSVRDVVASLRGDE